MLQSGLETPYINPKINVNKVNRTNNIHNNLNCTRLIVWMWTYWDFVHSRVILSPTILMPLLLCCFSTSIIVEQTSLDNPKSIYISVVQQELLLLVQRSWVWFPENTQTDMNLNLECSTVSQFKWKGLLNYLNLNFFCLKIYSGPLFMLMSLNSSFTRLETSILCNRSSVSGHILFAL